MAYSLFNETDKDGKVSCTCFGVTVYFDSTTEMNEFIRALHRQRELDRRYG